MLKHRAAATEADRAIELRDAGLSVLEVYGRWKPCGSRDLHMLTADVSNLLILYRTPFQKIFKPSERMKYMAAVFGQPPRTLPYGLDIWHGKKVLSIDWDDAEAVEIRSFAPGKWEDTLLAVQAGHWVNPGTAGIMSAAGWIERFARRSIRPHRRR
jgi:hypothetical protein